MSFGKFKGKAVAWVMIEKMDYFRWMDSKGMTDKPEYQFMLKLVNKFDNKPFSEVHCAGSCDRVNEVKVLSLYNSRYNIPYWFCDQCDPYVTGARDNTLSFISSMNSVINHPDKDRLIKLFAQAKGMPKIKTKQALKEFFAY